MNDPVTALIGALRKELEHYGEMLARLDKQQDCIVRRAADEFVVSVENVQEHSIMLQAARRARNEWQARLAVSLGLPPYAQVSELLELVHADYCPLRSA